MLAGWSPIAAAILTGLIALRAYFGTGSRLLGRPNDLNTTLMTLATVPIALALHPLASRASGALATAAVAADVVGVLPAAGFSALLLLRLTTWDAARTVFTVRDGLIGVWWLMTAALALSAALLPAGLGWLGIAGGAGMAEQRWAFRDTAGSPR